MDLEPRHGHYKTFIGTSTREARGEEFGIEDALNDAWEHAKQKGYSEGRFRIVEVQFTAANPINEYSVIITPV